jgi:crossover junction endodeoxyribonuclease RuvC
MAAVFPCRVLGIDPGSLRTGFGVVDCLISSERHIASGCIRARGDTLAARLREIFEAVAALVEQYQPQEVAIERVFMHRNPDSALKLGQARGAALCAAVGAGAPVFEYAPRAIKLAVVGTGAADKTQVAHMIQALLSIKGPMSPDASDALAVGLCHGQARRANHLIARSAVGSRR